MDKDNLLQNLLDKYLNNTCTREELEELLGFLKRADNEPHIKNRLSEVWEDLKKKEGEQETETDEQQAWFEEIYAQAQMREAEVSGYQETGQSKIKQISSRRWKDLQWVNIAAVLIFSAMLSLAHYFYNESQAPQLEEVVYSEKVAAPGEKVRFMLSDGTQVHLNSGSRIEYVDGFEDHIREVTLEGEAFFVVASDTARPFFVHSGDILTRVLGTSFNIRSYTDENEATIAVASGEVAVMESGSDVAEENYGAVLQANQWTTYREEEHTFETNSGDIFLFTAWQDDVLLYKESTLEDVANRLELWYGVNIAFEDDAIKDCIIQGEHRNERLANVLESITYAFVDMEYTIEGREIRLSGRGCR